MRCQKRDRIVARGKSVNQSFTKVASEMRSKKSNVKWTKFNLYLLTAFISSGCLRGKIGSLIFLLQSKCDCVLAVATPQALQRNCFSSCGEKPDAIFLQAILEKKMQLHVGLQVGLCNVQHCYDCILAILWIYLFLSLTFDVLKIAMK